MPSFCDAVPAPTAILAATLGAALVSPVAARADTIDEQQGNPAIVVVAPEQDGANPDADPAAPYLVRRSANDRLTEEVADTPRTIVVIPKEVIEDIGATSFRDVVRTTPGVTLGTGEGGNAFGDRVFIRGFEARNDVYIDGLRDPGVTSREIFAVEQIEVIRGPSGSFGGRGTTGGLVSLQSKRPQFGSSWLMAEAGAGTDSFWRGTIDANIALGTDAVVRVNALYHSADTPGRDYVFSERYGAAIAASWRITDTLAVTADYYGLRLDALPDFGHPFDTLTQMPYAVDRNNFYGVVGRDFLENTADIATLRVDFAPIEALSMRALVRYGESRNTYIVGAPGAVCRVQRTSTGACPTTGTAVPESAYTVGAGGQRRDAETGSWSALFDATARLETGPFTHTLILGGEYGNERVDSYSLSVAAFVEDANGNQTSVPPFVWNLLDPVPVLAGVQPVTRNTAIAPTEVQVESMAAYAIDTITLGERWFLTLAGRLDSYTIRLFNPTANGGAGLRLSNDAIFFNSQVSLLYKPTPSLSLYASYATSANPSGEQTDGNGIAYDGLAVQTVNLAPERNRSFEAGVKWELAGGHTLLTAAVFQITKENARENLGGNVYDLVGELRSRGVELGLTGSLTSRLQIFGGYTYTDARIVDSATVANIGRRFANIPQHSGNLLVTYALTGNLQIGAQVYAQDELFGGTLAAGSAHVPGYVRFDAMARWRPTDRTELRLNILNLTDQTYYDAIYRSGSPFAYVAPGRSAMLTASYRL